LLAAILDLLFGSLKVNLVDVRELQEQTGFCCTQTVDVEEDEGN
jgi:hypothetical protein